jgi:hypothetical protein
MIRVLFALTVPFTLSAQFTVHLLPQTDRAFEDYRKTAEARMDWHAHPPAGAGPGDVAIAAWVKKGAIEIKDGMVHDWVAATVAPGATVEQALALLQNYAAYRKVYAPEVSDSKLLSHDGNRWRAYLRLVKQKVLTVVLDGEYEVEYRPLGDGRWAVVSRSVKMTEVEGGRELPQGTGHGFLWRLNAYWLIEPRKEGVYLECRTISLSRDIPHGLSWMIRPIVASLPRESLRETLDATVRALGSRH